MIISYTLYQRVENMLSKRFAPMLPVLIACEFKVKSNGGSRRAQQESWDAAREQGGEKSHAIEIYL